MFTTYVKSKDIQRNEIFKSLRKNLEGLKKERKIC